MKTVIFQGYLKELYPDGIRVDGSSAEECVALLGNYPGFRQEDGVRHRVYLPKFLSRDSLSQRTNSEVIEVVPFEKDDETKLQNFTGSGGKNGGWIQIIIGVVIIVAAFFGYGSPETVQIGLAMVLGGALRLLMPQPPKTENTNDPRSNYLAANKNTVAVGTTIPILIGKRKVYGHILSFNVTATNINAPTLPPSPIPGVGTAIGSAVEEVIYDNGDWSSGP